MKAGPASGGSMGCWLMCHAYFSCRYVADVAAAHLFAGLSLGEVRDGLCAGAMENQFAYIPFVPLTWIALSHLVIWQRSLLCLYVEKLWRAEIYDMSITSLLVYWLNGISQVFLVNSWIAGILFIAAFAVGSLKAAFWAMAGSAVALGVTILFGADSQGIADGLYGFSPVLTAIAV